MTEKAAFEQEAATDPNDNLVDESDARESNASSLETHSSFSESPSKARLKGDRFVTWGAWLVAISLVLFTGYLGLRTRSQLSTSPAVAFSQSTAGSDSDGQSTAVFETIAPGEMQVNLPDFDPVESVHAISRRASLLTIIPTRPREDVITYTVKSGDSIFSIAKNFNIKPETLLWANYDLLKDSPDMLSLDMELKVPPIDGVYYSWLEGDTFEGVATKFKANAQDILNWTGNNLDLVDPQIEAGQMILVPGGEREFVQWVVPTIPRGQAGVSRAVYGAGACSGGYEGAYGTGFFVWPSVNRTLSGNDYWSGHLGIDIAAGVGDGVFAADSGVVVFSGWAYGGYGYMLMIDHGNGYQTVYAHLSQVTARCGQSVTQGQYVGATGSTGNSTGPHLHFEIRYFGGFINPWSVLP